MQKDLQNFLSELSSVSKRFASHYGSYIRDFIGSLCPELRSFSPKKIISTLAAMASLTLAAPALASVGVWTYAGQNYPTQTAALAAMHAVSAENALLTIQKGISGMGTATVTFTYGAPQVPWSLTTTCYGDEFPSYPGCYATEAGAIQYYISLLTTCSANDITITIVSAWFYAVPPPNFEASQGVWLSSQQPGCGLPKYGYPGSDAYEILCKPSGKHVMAVEVQRT